MPIDSSVAELITAQLFVLVQEAPDPIYFYINSTGIAVSSICHAAEKAPCGSTAAVPVMQERQDLDNRAVHHACGMLQPICRLCFTGVLLKRLRWYHGVFRVCVVLTHAALLPLALQKSNSKYGNEHEAIAVYHMMRGVEKFCPIYTLCIGNAFGEAALLLAAGSKVRQFIGSWQPPASVRSNHGRSNRRVMQHVAMANCRAEACWTGS